MKGTWTADGPEPMTYIDAYAHVSLPRFMSADEFMAVMDAHGVSQAFICTADTGPDLRELHRALKFHSARFRVGGLPLGDSPSERLDSVAAQMAAGFSAIRLHDREIAEHGELLGPIGKAGGIPYVVGGEGLRRAAGALAGFLEEFPSCSVCAPHFAGGGDPVLLKDPDIRRLYSHPRFHVIFSRHGAYERENLKRWAGALVEAIGWDRLMYGSEYPVVLWRDETYSSTLSWLDAAGFAPSEVQRRAFFFENARRVIFSGSAPSAGALPERLLRAEPAGMHPVWLFPNRTIEISAAEFRLLMKRYLESGGDKAMGFHDFVARLLGRAAREL